MSWVEDIRKFNEDRGLLDQPFGVTREYMMLQDELEEFADFMQTSGERAIEAADIVVIAIGAIIKLGYDPDCIMREKLKEIISRRGSINPETGKWQKDPNQKVAYKAYYRGCKVD